MPEATPTPQIQVSKTNDAPVKFYKERDINKALESAEPGDTVVLAPGDYTSYNVFVPEDVYLLAKPGAILGYEFGRVQGFKRNIADLNVIGGAEESSDLGGPSGVLYYIRPLRGTAIKNSNPDTTLAIEIHRIKDGKDAVVDSGDIKLFYQDQSGSYKPIQNLDSNSDGYFAELGREDIDGSRKVFVMDSSKPLTENNVFDSITLADVQDGHGFVGWVNVTPSFTASKDEDGNFSPTFIELDPNFTFDGDVIDVANDSSFQFTSVPNGGEGIDVFGADNKVEVDAQTYFGSREKRQFSANWEAEYTGPSGKTFTFQLVETVYEAEDGKSSQTLQIISESQAFKVDKDGTISPDSIRLRASTQNISGVGQGGATINWTVDDTDPNGLNVTLRDAGGDPTTTGERVFLEAEDLPSDFVTATIRASVDDSVVRDPPVEDEVAVAKLIDGDPGFTVILTNENHTFPVEDDGTITDQNYSNGATSANVWRGTEKFTYDQNLSQDGTWRFREFSNDLNEVTPEGAIDVEVDDVVGRVVPSDMSFPTAIVQVTIEARYKGGMVDQFTRQVTYNKAQSGSDVKRLQLAANSQVFKVFQDGTVDPDPDGQGGARGKITLRALKANLDPQPDDEILWSTDPEYVLGTDVASDDDSRISSDGEEFELFYEDLKNETGSPVDGISNNEFADQVTVSAQIEIGSDEYSDQFTVFRLEEGSDAYTLALTNEAHAISTNAEGIPLANQDPQARIPGAETDIRLFQGIQEITENSDTEIEIQATDDVGKIKQTFASGGDQEVTAGDTLTLGGNNASPPEIYVSDIDFPVETGDNTASVDIQAKFKPSQDDPSEVVGRRTWSLSTAQKGNEGIQWVIKPLNGAAIKNSNPNKELTFEARKIIGETTIVLEQVPSDPDPNVEPQVPDSVSDLAIYVRNDVGGGDFEYIRACNAIWDENQSKFVVRNDQSGTEDCHPDQGTPLSPVLGTEQIQGETTLFLLRSATGNDDLVLETANGDVDAVLDEVDVLDVLDGLSGGYLEVEPNRIINIRQTQPDGGGFAEPQGGTNLEVIGNFTTEGTTSITNKYGVKFDLGYDTSPGGSGGSHEVYVLDLSESAANLNSGAIEIDSIDFLGANGGTKSVTSKNEVVNDDFGTGSNEREIAGFRAIRVSYTFTSPDTGQQTSAEDTFPVRKEAGPRFFIQPETGTAIKNKEGTVSLRAFKVQPNIEGREELDLYTTDGDDRDFAFVDSNDNIVGNQVGTSYGGNDPYRIEFDTNAISNDVRVSLKKVDDQGSPIGETLDSITLVDVTDGSDAVIGAIQASLADIDSNGNFNDPNSDTTLGFTYDPNVNEFDPPLDNINDGGSDDYYLIATFFRQGDVIEHDGQKARASLRVKFNEGTGTVEPDGTNVPNVYSPGNLASDGEDYKIQVTTNTSSGTRSLRGRFAYSSTNFLENSFDLVEGVVVSPGGLDGDNARVVTLSAPSLTFKEDKNGNVSPNSITLTANGENLRNTTWDWFEDGTNVGSGNVQSDNESQYTVQPGDLGADDQIDIRVEAKDGPTNVTYEDSTTIVRLIDGSDAITPLLSNPAHTYQADADGSVDNPGNGNNTVSVFEGASKLSYVGTGNSFPNNGEFRLDVGSPDIIDNRNVNDLGSDAQIEIVDVDDSGSVTEGVMSVEIYVKKNNGDTVKLNQNISYSKSIAGPKGDKGDQGPAGPGVVYRGRFDSSKEYFDRDNRKDVVVFDPGSGDQYYLTDNTNKDGQSNWNDPDTSDWAAYGQQFESVATDFLLAQDATITNTLTMGEAGSDSGLIRSAVEPNAGEPLYEIGLLVDADGDGSRDGEGIRYRNRNGDVVFEVLGNKNLANIGNLTINGSLASNNTNSNGNPIYEMDGDSIILRDSDSLAFRADSGGAVMDSLDVTGPVRITNGNFQVPGSETNSGEPFFYGDFEIDVQDINTTDTFTSKLSVSSSTTVGEEKKNSDSATYNFTQDVEGWDFSFEEGYDLDTGKNGGAEVTLTVKILDGNGNEIKSGTKSESTADQSGTLSFSFVLTSDTSEAKIEREVSATAGSEADGDPTSSSATLKNDEVLEAQGITDEFVGPKGAAWNDGGDEKVRIDGVEGRIYVDDVEVHSSDLRDKQDVSVLNNPIRKLKSIRGITFTKPGSGRRAGVAAQDLKGSFDEVLHGGARKGYYVSYRGIHALNIEVMKDHERRISDIEKQLS